MRKEIFEVVIAKQKELINNLRDSLSIYDESTDLEEKNTMDLDAQARNSDNQEIKVELTRKLNLELERLKKIKSIQLIESDEIVEGSIIDTDQTIFVVGLAFPTIKYNDKNIVGMSTHAPAYENNQGRQKGDKIQLGDKQVIINNIL